MIAALQSLINRMVDWFKEHRWIGWILRLCVTAFVLGWVLSYIDLEQFRRVTIAPKWLPLIAMVLSAWLFVFVGALKFWYIFKAVAPVPFKPFLLHFLVATSIGTFTPASMGDFSLAAFLRDEKIPAHQSFSIILVDRVITVSIYGILFLPLTLGLLLHTTQLWWVPFGVLVMGILLLAANANSKIRRKGRMILEILHWPFITGFVRTTSDLFRSHPWTLIGNVVLTLTRCSVAGLVVQCALFAAGEIKSFFPVLLTTNSISLLNLLPVSLAGLGIYEGGGVAIFSQLGFDPERVLAALIYQRAYVIVYSLIMLAVTHILKNRLRRNAEAPSHVG